MTDCQFCGRVAQWGWIKDKYPVFACEVHAEYHRSDKARRICLHARVVPGKDGRPHCMWCGRFVWRPWA